VDADEQHGDESVPQAEDRPTYEDAAPHILAAIEGYRAGDRLRVGTALRELIALGPKSMYGTLASFAHLAAYAVPRRAVPGGTWFPALYLGDPPRRANIDEHPAAAFALRFLAATLNDDQGLRWHLYQAFVDRNGDADANDEAAAQEGAAALVLMVQLAVRGIQAREARAAATHQHPHARHQPHGRNPRRK
jgi:hypothetical protein